jgi:transposase
MNDLSRSRKVLEQDGRLIAVVELSLSNWVVAGIVPGLDPHPVKKLGADHDALLQLVERWRDEAIKAGRTITRTVVAFEAGREGFWLAPWLKARGEPDHCHMAAIPTPDQEDARRPNRERENLIGQQTRIINRMKACLVRWGSAISSRRFGRPQSVSRRSARPRASPCPRIPSPKRAETWRVCHW